VSISLVSFTQSLPAALLQRAEYFQTKHPRHFVNVLAPVSAQLLSSLIRAWDWNVFHGRFPFCSLSRCN